MRKLGFILLVLLLAGALAYSQRGKIAERIMSRGIEMAMTTDTLAELGEGLHMTVCGAEHTGNKVMAKITDDTLSQDGTSFSLPPNSKEIIRTREKI